MTTGATSPFITFFVGNEQFAAHAADVSEVFRRPKITRVPGGPSSLLGIAGLRGVAAPVVSLARLWGQDDQVGDASRLLLLEGAQSIGVMVDRVGSLMNLATPDGDASGTFGRLYAVEDATLRVLDLDCLLRGAFAGVSTARRPRTEIGSATQFIEETEAQVALLSFDLAGQAYALPLAQVSEVMTLPDRLAAIAQSEVSALGVISLRDRLLPVISLRTLLGLGGVFDPGARVVVTAIGDALVGLAVDHLNAIVRVDASAIDVAPPVLNRGDGEAQVQSICRAPDGRGLIAILSPDRLFRDEKIAQILADGRSQGSEMIDQQLETVAEAGQYLIFRIGAEEYGLPLASVEEVLRLPERLTRLPKAPAFVEGVLNLRGKVVPVIDQRSRFGAERSDETARPRVVVAVVEGKQAGFIVDTVSEILGLPESALEMTPVLTADASQLFDRVATLDGGERLILIIQPKALLDRAERDLLAGLDAEVAAQT